MRTPKKMLFSIIIHFPVEFCKGFDKKSLHSTQEIFGSCGQIPLPPLRSLPQGQKKHGPIFTGAVFLRVL